MQIKYLKDAPLGKAGDVAEVAQTEANILITLGYAREHKGKASTAKTDKSDDQTDLLTPATNTDSE